MVNMPISEAFCFACREFNLYFAGTHWFDLKTVLSDLESPP